MPDDMPADGRMPAGRCANCDATLTGQYCAICGQSARSINLPLSRFLSEAVGELLAFDARLFRTVGRLVARPGSVAREYMDGRRARFVPPFRLYLFVSLVFFVLNVLNPNSTVVTTVETEEPSAAELVVAAPDSSSSESDEPDEDRVLGRFTTELAQALDDPDEMSNVFWERFSQVMFFLVPGFALLLKLMYRRRLYVEHLVYALYFHVFVFLLGILVTLPAVLGLVHVGDWLGLLFLGVPFYLYAGMRGMYGARRWPTVARAGFVMVSYLLMLLAGMLVALVLTVLL